MSNAKHSPGPWHLFGGMVDGYGISSADGEVITQGAFNGLHNAANARLIEASPDLLAALEEIIANTTDEDGNATVPMFASIVSTARAAIAKATNS